MLPTPGWLKLKRWRQKRQPPEGGNDSGGGCSNPGQVSDGAAHASDQMPGSNYRQAPGAESEADERREPRRLGGLMPRLLTNLIDRALSLGPARSQSNNDTTSKHKQPPTGGSDNSEPPAAQAGPSRSTVRSAGLRAESPLRKLHKHLRPKARQPPAHQAQEFDPRPGPQHGAGPGLRQTPPEPGSDQRPSVDTGMPQDRRREINGQQQMATQGNGARAPAPSQGGSGEAACCKSIAKRGDRQTGVHDPGRSIDSARKAESVCHLTARTRDDQCALHGRPSSAGPSRGQATSRRSAAARRRPRPKDKAAGVPTWPLAKQTLDNDLPDELRLGHFGDAEDILSAHLAGRLFGALGAGLERQAGSSQCRLARRPRPGDNELPLSNRRPGPLENRAPMLGGGGDGSLQESELAGVTAELEAGNQLEGSTTHDTTANDPRLVSQLRALNYNHKRPFGRAYETPATGWLYNATGLEPIDAGSTAALKAKLFASTGYRRRSYDDQEGDNDFNIILQPSDIYDIERRAKAEYAQIKAAALSLGSTRLGAARLDAADNDDRSDNKEEIDGTRIRTTNRLTPSQLNRDTKLNALTNIFEDIKLAKCLLDQDYNQTVRLFIGKSALNWNFNSFTFDALCCGRSLTELLVHLFDFYNLYDIFKLDIIKVLKCFRLLEFGYHSTNPYHNSVHAADVTQAMHCFIQENKIRRHMTNLEILCSILAAVCHDLDHPGVNQSFLVATNNPLAGLYQNNSVLENHHWRFALCIFKEAKLFDHFQPDVLDDMKDQLKHLILATDIARQNEYLKRFKDLTSSKDFSMSNTDDRALVLQMALKCADLGNPCRPWLISRVWSNLICDEFYRMGQIERRLGVPLTPICQREKTSIAGIQTDFFRFIVLPLLELWHNFLKSPLSSLLMTNFDHNYKRWQRANRIVQQLRRRKSVACLEPIDDADNEDRVNAGLDQEIDRRKARQDRSSSVFADPIIEILYKKHSFSAIKRASSDYIKSGNGKLELLRDFQLNRMIEKSPKVMRAYRRQREIIASNYQALQRTNKADKHHQTDVIRRRVLNLLSTNIFNDPPMLINII